MASQAPRSLKEASRASSKEVARRSEKMEAPVTASMLPGLEQLQESQKRVPQHRPEAHRKFQEQKEKERRLTRQIDR